MFDRCLVLTRLIFATVIVFFSVVAVPSVQALTSLDEAGDLYDNKCASCHGTNGNLLVPNRYSFTSLAELIEIYDDVAQHGIVRGCGDDCIEDTNIYLWKVLWGKGTCTDNDSDTYFEEDECSTPMDCNDNDASISPAVSEDCSDSIDNDCDGQIDCADDDCASNPVECACTDGDGDTFYLEDFCGSAAVDCNDEDENVNPDASEIAADGIDNDCDGMIDNLPSASDDSSRESKNSGCFISTLF